MILNHRNTLRGSGCEPSIFGVQQELPLCSQGNRERGSERDSLVGTIKDFA